MIKFKAMLLKTVLSQYVVFKREDDVCSDMNILVSITILRYPLLLKKTAQAIVLAKQNCVPMRG